MASMVAADFGLSRPRREGLQVLTFIDTEYLGAKAIILLPEQTMLEHWHPQRGEDPGKEETLRCLSGVCRVYVPGEVTLSQGFIPEGQEEFYTCRNEIILEPTEQYTFPPGTPHWFQAGEAGTVVLSISTQVTDLDDRFSNPSVVRKTVYE
jgi:D-lyxose ketol-isomerase